jgi:hypothetical protein
LGFPPFTTAIEPLVDPIATHRQATCDVVAAPVEPHIQPIAALFERDGATRVSVVGLPVSTAVEAGFDAVATSIEPSLRGCRPMVQAAVDAITASVQALFDALAMSGCQHSSGSQEQQRAGQRDRHDSHGTLPVCRKTLLQGKTPALDAR